MEIDTLNTGSSILQPPPGVIPYETSISQLWFDKEGFFCSVTGKGKQPTVETLKQTFEYIRQNSKTGAVCWLGDVSDAASASKEAREFAREQTPKFVKALALITRSAVSRLFSNIFLAVNSPPYPVRMFTDEEEARKWLRKFR